MNTDLIRIWDTVEKIRIRNTPVSGLFDVPVYDRIDAGRGGHLLVQLAPGEHHLPGLVHAQLGDTHLTTDIGIKSFRSRKTILKLLPELPEH